MRIPTGTFVSLVLIALLTTMSVGKSLNQDENNEPEKLIKSAHFLEQKPFDKDAKKIRSWAMEWIIKTDKVSVKLCGGMFSGQDKYKYDGELFGQYAIGMAAFKLANADKAQDESLAQLAGLESALTAYESMLKEQPKAKNAFMDTLLAKRSDGSLAQHASDACKSGG